MDYRHPSLNDMGTRGVGRIARRHRLEGVEGTEACQEAHTPHSPILYTFRPAHLDRRRRLLPKMTRAD